MRDPIEEALDKREREEEAWLKSRPVCDVCGEHIQEESYHNFNGTKVCDQCLDCFREWID